MTQVLSKTAPSDIDIHDLIAHRWSPRAFAPTPIEGDTLQKLFEAARWAPSASNTQPWRFLLTRQGEAGFIKLHGCLSRGNQPWTEHVPVLLLSVAQTVLPAKDDKPARENATALHDLGLALANLTLQATALELSVHPMAGFDRDATREAFALPEGFTPVTVSAIGYAAPSTTLPDDLRAREEAPRTRKPLSELVFEDNWGNPAPFTAL